MFYFLYKFFKALYAFCMRGQYFKRRFSACALLPSSSPTRFLTLLSLAGVLTLAKIKPQFIRAHLEAMAEPTDPKELAVVNAQDQYETSSIELNKLIAFPLPQDADVAAVDLWVIDAKTHWETCTQNWRIAKVTSLEWRKLEYAFLEVFAEVPEDLVAYSCGEYNELAKRARLFNMPVTTVPMSQMPSRQSVPQEPTPSTVVLPTVSTRTRTATPVVVSTVPQTSSVPTPVVIPPPPTTTTPLSVVPPRGPLPVKPRPIFKKKTTAAPGELSTAGTIFALDITSPLHPDLAALVKTGPPKGVTPSTGATRSSQRLQVVNAASRPQVLPGPNPISEGSVASSSRRRTPLFFPGTDDEEEIATPGVTGKGKGKEVVQGTNEDEEDFSQDQDTPSHSMAIDEDEDNSPPPTNIAWRYRSPVPAASSGPPPITVSEVRPLCSILHADPNSTLFKLLGASDPKNSKKGSRKKSKFDNPPPAPSDSAAEGTVKASRASKKTIKASKDKEVVEVSKGEVVATKVNRPRGPSRIRPPLATMGIQGGGFVVSRDFGNFVEVDKALWNKKIAPFVGEQYVKQCDQCYRKKTQCCKFLTNSVICIRCHYAKLPCLVNGTKALNPLAHYRPKEYQSLNAFESALTTLTQHANNLEDVVVNYLVGLDAMSQLQGLRTQISHLRECLGSDTRVEEIVEDNDDEGYAADEVAEGEPGPLKKRKRSGK
ncbi:hypothetical protein EDD18DRAFT_1347279 [Armillaria luteobubalina]|uniref:Zn(2)-C6 fungal-type domain-containing protein n=1 Tax=Armillaria luteobubalina TaxID=153913 RepID=A0AA39QGJ8_9AGAR|nr:hypothetical protein EDD18DRAFT_1347279 [Armillaria luteobubalina]